MIRANPQYSQYSKQNAIQGSMHIAYRQFEVIFWYVALNV